jgi:hypothetical protein
VIFEFIRLKYIRIAYFSIRIIFTVGQCNSTLIAYYVFIVLIMPFQK